MTNRRVQLPKVHWLETPDPWEVTERDAKQFRQGLPKAAEPASIAGTPPQLAQRDEDDGLTEQRGIYTLAWTIRAWGGEYLDGKEVNAETFEGLPMPLSRKINQAVTAFWKEVSGEDPTETP